MRKALACVGLVLASGLVSADPPSVQTDRAGARVLPLPKEEGVFHFVIYGDRTGGPPEGIRVLERAVRETNLLGPDLVMTVGDLVQGYNTREEWLPQMREYRGVMDHLLCPWFPVAGNHDVNWGGSPAPRGHHESDFEEHFGPLWYWFSHKNAAFVVLYSDEGDPLTNRKGWDSPSVNRMSEKQLSWLAKTLQATKPYDHVFVFLHHPRWISASYPGTNWDTVHDLLKAAGNVTAVFAGHIHRERYDGVKDGIQYFTLAAVGAVMPMDVPGTGWLHHMDVVTVRKDRITIASIPVGAVLDPREMTPERWAEIDALRFLTPQPSNETLALGPDGAGMGTVQIRLRNPTNHELAVTVEPLGHGRGWWFSPDHEHATVPAGEEMAFRFAWWRESVGLALLSLPTFTVDLDYLGETTRVSMPQKEFPLPIALPTDVFDGAEAALVLDGASAPVRLPMEAFDLPDGPLTVEAWVRPTALDGRRGVLSKLEGSEYGILLNDGAPSFHVFSGDRYATVQAKSRLDRPDEWHHIAGVFDGKEARLYVDGKSVGARAGEGRRKRNPWPLMIGADPGPNGKPMSFFQGLLDEVRLSTVARYSGESFQPERRFTPDSDTALLLHLDRTFGGVLPDHSPGHHHVAVEGTVRFE